MPNKTALRAVRGPTKRRWPRDVYMKIRSAQLLRTFIQASRHSYADVGRYAERDRTYIYQLASGRRSTCKPEVAEAIAGLLGVPVEALFEPRKSISAAQPVPRQGKAAA